MQISQNIHTLLVAKVNPFFTINANDGLLEIEQNIFKHFLLMNLGVQIPNELVLIITNYERDHEVDEETEHRESEDTCKMFFQ